MITINKAIYFDRVASRRRRIGRKIFNGIGIHILHCRDASHKANDLAFDPAYHDVEDPELVKARISAMKDMYPDALSESYWYFTMDSRTWPY